MYVCISYIHIYGYTHTFIQEVCVCILQKDKQNILLIKETSAHLNSLNVILEKICYLLFLSLLHHSGVNADVHFFVEIISVKNFPRPF